MRKRDATDVLLSLAAAVTDAGAVFGGFLWATWLRFDAGLIPLRHGRPPQLYALYSIGAAFATCLVLLVFRSQGLFVRPQTGSFSGKIPRMVKSVGIGILLTTVLAFAVKNEAEFSSVAIGLSALTVGFLVLLERYLLFRVEWNVARHSRRRNRVLVVGTDSVAARLRRTLRREPMLWSEVVGFLRADGAEIDPDIRPEDVKGDLTSVADVIAREKIDQMIVTHSGIGHTRIVDLILLCERNLIAFNMVPDLFRVMTSSMDVQLVDDIPLLGLRRWPLDYFWHRVAKRIEDVVGAAVGLLVAAPIVGVAAVIIRRTSPGPALFRQERCGEGGEVFTLYKLRTMTVDAEAWTGPVFASEGDPRRTAVGAFLRRYNLDELPQLWNVLRGDMSLVGPRPERPHFVEKFREDVARYMWRHLCKPGVTGWAQVNGLRGNTSIEERIKYDLYYLENWSLAFDFKILVRTLFARQNAY
jgi:exopolysaccharide biosynthesis polyprenyl glycosylphosphotransferase